MVKQKVQQKETQVSTTEGIGKQLEQTLIVDDNMLPSPEELEAYKKVDPRIVDFWLNSSLEEQKHRHLVDKEKIDIVKKSERRIGRMNWWGMCFAFLSIVVLVLLAGYALYLNREWIAGILGATTLFTVASIFIKKENK